MPKVAPVGVKLDWAPDDDATTEMDAACDEVDIDRKNAKLTGR